MLTLVGIFCSQVLNGHLNEVNVVCVCEVLGPMAGVSKPVRVSQATEIRFICISWKTCRASLAFSKLIDLDPKDDF